MISKIVSGGLWAVVWDLAATGFAALVLAGLVAWPVQQPPELTSISGDAFDLWLAFVNGGGLVLGGLWMRRS